MKRRYAATCLALILCLLIGAKYFVEANQASNTSRGPSSVSFSEIGYKGKALKQFSFGFDSLFAGLIWIELLQKAQLTPVEKGTLSWEFMQLDTITELDPAFERAYGFGAPFISTLRRDAEGGKILLQKWVRRRPDNWRSHYTLGLHLFQEFQDYQAAAPLILKAASLSRAPQWLSALGVRLLSEGGFYLHALKTATEVFDAVRDKEGRLRLKARIRTLNYHVQKNAWDNALKDYLKTHARPPNSIAQLRDLLRTHVRELSSVIGSEKLAPEVSSILRETFAFQYDKIGRKIVSEIPLETLGIERPGIYHENGR